jgi:putative transposase
MPATCGTHLLVRVGEPGGRIQFLLRDRDAKFYCSFDGVFRLEGAEVLLTPVRAPEANAYAECWIRTVRADRLDWLLIVGRGHLDRFCEFYVKHYNEHRPHGALGPLEPDRRARVAVVGEAQQGRVPRRDLLGGLLHEHQRAA